MGIVFSSDLIVLSPVSPKSVAVDPVGSESSVEKSEVG